jgi:hypothetical protein
MKHASAVALILTAFGGVVAAPPPPAEKFGPKDGPREFLRLAIIDGLTEDGVPPAFAESLAKKEGDYIGKCSICQPVHSALVEFAMLNAKPTAKEGKGLEEAFAMRLTSDKDEVRRGALRELVQRYVEREYVRLNLDADRRGKIEKEMEQMRKISASGLPKTVAFCPSCDGACKLAPKP